MAGLEEIVPIRSYSNDEDYPDFTDNPDVYFQTLQKITKVAQKLRIKEDEEEKKLVEFLPVNERFTLDKENKVLTRWQERQKDWEKIEQLIKKKILLKANTANGGGGGHKTSSSFKKSIHNRPLMMTTTDEYRAKLEEYDLIQAAIPLKDKFADSAWQMSLRGGGPIIVNVGHIFSGLECTIEPKSVIPKMVRKPKPITSIWKNDTFIEPTEDYLRKVKKYEQSLQTIRPHNLTYQEASNISISTVNLFQWAKQSSEDFIAASKEKTMLTIEEEQELVEEQDDVSKDISHSASSVLLHKRDPDHLPRLEFLSSQEVLLEIKDPKQRTAEGDVLFKNSGNITLYYRWKKIDPPVVSATDITPANSNANGVARVPSAGSALISQKQGSRKTASMDSIATATTTGTAKNKNKQYIKSLQQTFNEKSNDLEPLRSRILAQERESFHILNPCGEILPGETISSHFIFTNRTGNTGIHKTIWRLQFLPEETQITFPNDHPTGSSSDGVLSSQSSTVYGGKDSKAMTTKRKGKQQDQDEKKKKKPKSYLGSLLINCKGMITFPDDTVTRRQQIHQQLENSMTATIMKDILYDVLRHVRQPLRLKDLQQRKIQYFEKRNQDLLFSIFQDPQKEKNRIPYIITIERVGNLEKLSYKVENTVQTIIQYYQSLLSSPEVIESITTNPFYEIAYENNYPFQESTRQDILQDIFPEQNLEIFDEVNFDEINPNWDYAVNTPLQALQSLQPILEEIQKLEAFIAQQQKQKEKERLREEQRAKRIADGDDEEEEEEEEEEPEEEDEDAKKRKPKHSLVIETTDLQSAIISELHKLASYDLPSQDIYDVTKNALYQAIDTIFEAEAYAINTAGIAEIINNGGKIPPVESPYSSEAGKAQWETIMNTTSASSEPVDPKKKDKPPAKGAPPPTTLTAQQCDFYHKLFYEKLRDQLLTSLASSIVPETYPIIKDYVERTFYTADLSKQTTAQAFTQIGTWRGDEVYHQFILYSLPTKDVTPDDQLPYPASAYAIYDQAKANIAKELVQLISSSPYGIVLLQEMIPTDPNHIKSSFTFEKQFDSFKEFIQNYYTLWMTQDTKQRKKNKLKDPKVYPVLHFLYFKTIGEFYYYFQNLLQFGQYSAPSTGGRQSSSTSTSTPENYFQKFIPIYFIENLSYDDVIPIPPEYEAHDSDDDEVTISIGKEDYQQRIKQKWLNSRPHRVNVEFVLNNPTIPKVGVKEVTVSNKKHTQAVYADSVAAIEELYYQLITAQKRLTSSQSPSFETEGDGRAGVLYIEHNPQALFNEFSSFYRLSSKKFNKKIEVFSPTRYVSHTLREGILWTSILQLLPQFLTIVQPIQEKLANNIPILDVTQPPSYTTIEEHLYKLFPQQITESKRLSSLFILGGELRMDKFRVLDELISLVDTIYLVGEMALPFVVLFSEAVFPNFDTRGAEYIAISRLLVAKARLSGCSLYYPQDIQLAEDPIKPDDKLKCYQNIVTDSRSDGADYEGDVKNTPIVNSGAASMAYYGYYYDIGTETIKHLQDVARNADLIVVWGTSGVNELNSFQGSQQAIIQAVTVKPSDDKATINNSPPKHTLLWGDSTVEWFARFLDSDGELGGNLVGAGLVSYQNRDSTVLRSIIGHYTSEPLVKSAVYREPVGSEWIYTTRIIELEEEEEEEEEEDDEEQ